MKKYSAILLILFFFQFSISSFSFKNESLYIDNGLYSYSKENPKIFESGLKLAELVKNQLQEEAIENPDFVLALTFPELLRYSEYSDKIETLTNYFLYRATPESEGLSIGYFQMKPIFAESIEIAIARDTELRKKYSEINFYGKKEKKSQRINRIKRLKDLRTEYTYILAFIDICSKKFSLEDEEAEVKLKLLAAAYNASFFYTRQQLELISQKNAYPFGSNSIKSKWNYAQISYDYYSATVAE